MSNLKNEINNKIIIYSFVTFYFFYLIYKAFYFTTQDYEINNLINGVYLFEGLQTFDFFNTSSLITWLIFIKILFEIITNLIINFITTENSLFNSFYFSSDKTFFKNYQNLNFNRIFLLLIHFIFFITLLFKLFKSIITNQNQKNFTYKFFLYSLSLPFVIVYISLASYQFLGIIFLLLSFLEIKNLNQNFKNIFISAFFLSCSVACNIMITPFIFIIFIYVNKKYNLKFLLIFFLFLFTLSPWLLSEFYYFISNISDNFFIYQFKYLTLNNSNISIIFNILFILFLVFRYLRNEFYSKYIYFISFHILFISFIFFFNDTFFILSLIFCFNFTFIIMHFEIFIKNINYIVHKLLILALIVNFLFMLFLIDFKYGEQDINKYIDNNFLGKNILKEKSIIELKNFNFYYFLDSNKDKNLRNNLISNKILFNNVIYKKDFLNGRRYNFITSNTDNNYNNLFLINNYQKFELTLDHLSNIDYLIIDSNFDISKFKTNVEFEYSSGDILIYKILNINS